MCYNYKYDTAETIKGDSSMVPWRYCPFLVPASARRAAAEKFVEWKGKHLMKQLLAFGVASVLALSLAACGGASSTAASSEGAENASSEAATTDGRGK